MIESINGAKLRDLKSFNNYPELLVTPLLQSQVDRPESIKAVAFENWIGTLDNGNFTDLSVVIAEGGYFSSPTPSQEPEDSPWGKALNRNRAKLINKGLLNAKDRALMLFIAQDWKPDGIYIETFIESVSIRKRGVGKDFFANLENILSILGYKYWGGTNYIYDNNTEFFLKLGVIKVDDLIKNPPCPRLTLPGLNSINMIKFIDPRMKAEYVRSQTIYSPLKDPNPLLPRESSF